MSNGSRSVSLQEYVSSIRHMERVAERDFHSVVGAYEREVWMDVALQTRREASAIRCLEAPAETVAEHSGAVEKLNERIYHCENRISVDQCLDLLSVSESMGVSISTPDHEPIVATLSEIEGGFAERFVGLVSGIQSGSINGTVRGSAQALDSEKLHSLLPRMDIKESEAKAIFQALSANGGAPNLGLVGTCQEQQSAGGEFSPC